MKNRTSHLTVKKSVQLLAVGICTGLLVGVVVTFFNLAADLLSKYSKNIYGLVRDNPAFVPLLFLVLAVSAFVIGILVYLIPMIRGSGIPQTEGASRGLLRLKWYQVLPAMAASSLYCMFLGLSAGSEGPSMYVGGVCGEAMGKLLGCSEMERRYQITGGACAGLATAFNAPLTGIVFAFEEAHRRFTPSIFICAFSSVLTALITKSLLFKAMGMEITSVLSTFSFVRLPLKYYLFVGLAAVISGLFGVIFYKLGMLMRKLFAKLTVLKGILRILIAFLLAGAAGLITVYAIGGGRSVIGALGTNGGESEMTLAGVFSSPIVATLVIVLVIRLLTTSVNLGAGVPCGLFIPMLTLGALIGALTSKLCGVMGMESAYSDCIVMISMATFFASVVKAPMTSIIIVVELTWQFTLLIPVILGVSIGYMLSELFGMKPLYEALLESIMEEENLVLSRHVYSTTLDAGSAAAGQAIRDVLWPGNLLIRSIKREGVQIVPNSDTILLAGDELTVQAETTSLETLKECTDEIVKQRKNPVFEKIRTLFSRTTSKRKNKDDNSNEDDKQ